MDLLGVELVGLTSFHQFHGVTEPWRPRKWAQDVQPPDCEWPRKGYSLQASCRLMDLLGVELVGLTSFHQFHGVTECRGPIEPTAERLANEGP